MDEYEGMPEGVWIGHVWYTIEIADLVDDTEGKVGATHEGMSRIIIRTQLSETNVRGVLLHEIVHGIIQVFSPGLDEIKATIDRSPTLVSGEDIDEVYTRIMEIGLMSVFTNNPDLAAYLGWSE